MISVLILMFLIFLKTPLNKKNELIPKNNSFKFRNLEEEYGSAILHFNGIIGTKNIVNVNYVSKDKLSFYLKKENELIEIIDSALIEDSSATEVKIQDSEYSNYYIKKISFYLNGEDDEIVVKLKEKPDSLKALFAFSNATKITLEKFQTENVQTMESMFLECVSLTELDISGLDTSNVKNMYGMFMNCKALTELDVSSWNVSSVTNMEYLFYGCSALTKLDPSSWKTSNVNSMKTLFYNCNSLTQLDLSNWNTSNVNNM